MLNLDRSELLPQTFLTCLKEEQNETVPNSTGFIHANSYLSTETTQDWQVTSHLWLWVLCRLSTSYMHLWMTAFSLSLSLCTRVLPPPTIWVLFGEIFCRNHSHAVVGLPLWKAAPGRNSVLLLPFFLSDAQRSFWLPSLRRRICFWPTWASSASRSPPKKRENTSEIRTQLHPARLQHFRR